MRRRRWAQVETRGTQTNYDLLSRLYSDSSGGVATRYLYDGVDVIGEYYGGARHDGCVQPHRYPNVESEHHGDQARDRWRRKV